MPWRFTTSPGAQGLTMTSAGTRNVALEMFAADAGALVRPSATRGRISRRARSPRARRGLNRWRMTRSPHSIGRPAPRGLGTHVRPQLLGPDPARPCRPTTGSVGPALPRGLVFPTRPARNPLRRLSVTAEPVESRQHPIGGHVASGRCYLPPPQLGEGRQDVVELGPGEAQEDGVRGV